MGQGKSTDSKVKQAQMNRFRVLIGLLSISRRSLQMLCSTVPLVFLIPVKGSIPCQSLCVGRNIGGE
ncbi:hypothetical protein J6590_070727 [Homalodisca vitripennis]|nr:hypothetical protein J6590_070727 [Homalodisca vitripennis]